MFLIQRLSHRLFPPNKNRTCEVCFESTTTKIKFIPCAHKEAFCKECIRNWLKEKHTCPKCRAEWPSIEYVSQFIKETVLLLKNYLQLEATGQSTMVTHLTWQQRFNSYLSTFIGSMRATWRQFDVITDTLNCGAIGFLAILIIYPTLK